MIIARQGQEVRMKMCVVCGLNPGVPSGRDPSSHRMMKRIRREHAFRDPRPPWDQLPIRNGYLPPHGTTKATVFRDPPRPHYLCAVWPLSALECGQGYRPH